MCQACRLENRRRPKSFSGTVCANCSGMSNANLNPDPCLLAIYPIRPVRVKLFQGSLNPLRECLVGEHRKGCPGSSDKRLFRPNSSRMNRNRQHGAEAGHFRMDVLDTQSWLANVKMGKMRQRRGVLEVLWVLPELDSQEFKSEYIRSWIRKNSDESPGGVFSQGHPKCCHSGYGRVAILAGPKHDVRNAAIPGARKTNRSIGFDCSIRACDSGLT